MKVELWLVNCGFLLVNPRLKTHAHFKKHSHAKLVQDLIHKGLLPHQKRYQESCRRLLTPKEFEELTPHKPKEPYRRPQKHWR